MMNTVVKEMEKITILNNDVFYLKKMTIENTPKMQYMCLNEAGTGLFSCSAYLTYIISCSTCFLNFILCSDVLHATFLYIYYQIFRVLCPLFFINQQILSSLPSSQITTSIQ